jgi:Tol biopolymer transport system component
MRVIAGVMAAALLAGAPQTAPLVITIRQQDSLSTPLDVPSVDVSPDGRFVAFESYAALVPDDTNSSRDIYVLDRSDGRVTLESIGTRGDSGQPRISGDGRHVVFETVDGSSGGMSILLRDRRASTTVTVTAPGAGNSRNADISDDGRMVVFDSGAQGLVPGPDLNGSAADVYLFEVRTGALRRISLDDAGVQLQGRSFLPRISGDGRVVAFASTSRFNERAGALPRIMPALPAIVISDVFVRSLADGTTRLVSAAADGATDGSSSFPSVSGDGRYVAFMSLATNLVAGDRNRASDVFLHDREARRTTLVSRRAGGGVANGASAYPVISSAGRHVAFQSDASDLVCVRACRAAVEDINLLWDVFMFDRVTGQIARLSDDQLGIWMEPSRGPALDAEGTVIAFSSRHPVDARDRGLDFDLFVRAARE